MVFRNRKEARARRPAVNETRSNEDFITGGVSAIQVCLKPDGFIAQAERRAGGAGGGESRKGSAERAAFPRGTLFSYGRKKNPASNGGKDQLPSPSGWIRGM